MNLFNKEKKVYKYYVAISYHYDRKMGKVSYWRKTSYLNYLKHRFKNHAVKKELVVN